MVDHGILLDKLSKICIRTSTVTWFHSYVQGRMQVTNVDREFSRSGFVTCSVLQGSILGPLVFSTYINELPTVLSSYKVNLYADHMAVTMYGNDIYELNLHLNIEMKI